MWDEAMSTLLARPKCGSFSHVHYIRWKREHNWRRLLIFMRYSESHTCKTAHYLPSNFTLL